MANNYSQAAISPALPASLFSEAELQSLAVACGLSCERCGMNSISSLRLAFSIGERMTKATASIALHCCKQKLRQLDMTAYPHITIHGASTCDKIRPDEFGGFAYVITRDDIRSLSTWQWLAIKHGRAVDAAGR